MSENNIEIYRKVLTNTSPTVEIVGEGEEWNMTFKVGVSFVTFLRNDASEVNLKKSPWKHHSVNSSILPQCNVKVSLKTNKISFKIGEEFQESSPVDQTPQQVENHTFRYLIQNTHHPGTPFYFMIN